MTAYNPPKIVHTGPVWKPIGEVSASLCDIGLWIERVDGIRVPVRRHFGMWDREYSEELRERVARLEDEANHERLRSQQTRMYAYPTRPVPFW